MTVIRFSKQDYLMAFLNLYWLRPETALWRTLDCLALKDVEFHPPIIDIGCGDGVFSFTRAGGLFDPSYDVFIHTGKLDSFFLNVYHRCWAGQQGSVAEKGVVNPPLQGSKVGRC